ncbi:MAG: DUF1489 domain-containing protein [Kordiimonadaceae bacterium]|nr:DUF1489 domain-containing protein [Kordiimonadaceae bacterium]
MTIHLIKLAAGAQKLADIADKLAIHTVADSEFGSIVPVFTRNTPKQKEGLLAGGSLYWVAKGRVVARSPFVDVRAQTDGEGRAYCELCILPELIRVQPVPKRAFQGWRYLPAADAPDDIGLNESNSEDVSDEMLKELQELGLL